MKTILALVATVGVVLACAPLARADVEIVQQTTVSCPGLTPMLQSLPESQRALLVNVLSPALAGPPSIATTYIKGSQLRTDTGAKSAIVYAASSSAFLLNRSEKSYFITPYTPFQSSSGNLRCRVMPTHKTSIIFGHAVTSYSIRMTSSMLSQSVIVGELWAAADLQPPPAPHMTEGVAAAFQAEMSDIKGLPLAYHLVYLNTPAGDITVDCQTTSIKQDTLSASLFTIPSDFRKSAIRIAALSPVGGFPIGGGLPLESLRSVSDSKITAYKLPATASAPALPAAPPTPLAASPSSPVPSGISKMLSSMSPEQLQQLLSGLSTGAGAAAAPSANSGDLGKLLESVGGGNTPQSSEDIGSSPGFQQMDPQP